MILVTGATGNVGSELIQMLLDQGLPVRALTRDRHTARLPTAVDVRVGDLSDPSSLEGLFNGVQSALLLVHVPGNPAMAPNFLKAAKAANLPRLVLVSSLSTEALIEGDAIGEGHRALEQQVQRSGIPATILRAGTFASNALVWAEQIRAGDVVQGMNFAPAAPIDPQDVAAVAAIALSGPRHTGKILALTGGERLGSEAQVRILGEVLGRALRFEALPLDVLREFVRQSSEGHGDPDAIIKAVSGPNVPWAMPRADGARDHGTRAANVPAMGGGACACFSVTEPITH